MVRACQYPSMNIKIIGYVICAVVVLIAAVAAYRDIESTKTPLVFSNKEMLDALWQRYKAAYLEQGTSRTMDVQRGGVTTSEGEGYTMLRAVWLDDHTTFDASWKWTEDNLKFKNGYLFSWLFGKRADGTYGILTAVNGQNSASDADTDIATALMFAYARWRDVSYLQAAQNVAIAIWDSEVVMVGGKPYITSDDIEKDSPQFVTVDPSYFAPYAYRMFATIDPKHDWNGLVDDSYAVLKRSMQAELDQPKSDGLPPDWLSESRTGTSLMPPSRTRADAGGLKTDFGYDALRVPWRIALDWQWNKDPRALDILSSMSFLETQWQTRRVLYADYQHDGVPQAPLVESSAMYGGTIGAFMAMDPAAAKEIYDTKLVALYDPDSYSWKNPLGYYDDNWVWFGMALYDGELPDLWDPVVEENS